MATKKTSRRGRVRKNTAGSVVQSEEIPLPEINDFILPDRFKWVEAELIGNFGCPECGTTMLVTTAIPLQNLPYGFCFRCGKYFYLIEDGVAR